MRLRYWLLLLLVLGIGFWAARTSYFTVDRTEFVYLTQFGEPVASFDGETEAGFHWKLPWPIQSVQRIDHRLQVFDLPETELLTHDAKGKTIDKTLTVGAYVCWRIADKDGVDQFIRTVGTPEKAQEILGQRISSRLGAEISKMPVDQLINDAPDARIDQRMDQLRDRLLDGTAEKGEPASDDQLRALARKAYGIELVDIRLRRFNHPSGVRNEIFNRIVSERNEKARQYRNDGMKEASNITSLAQREARDIETEAKSKAEYLRKAADVKADEIRNQAHSKDREFYAFLQKLRTYQTILGDTRDVLLLSGKHELFDMLLKPPKPSSPESKGPNPEPTPMSKSGGGQ
ncbi:MAG: protease modulator HflC [Gemmataceae bacterium]|nr:protease modulator HflC [Gemmataceae bacterium]